MSCIDDIRICITRGSDFQQSVRLTVGFDEVVENPGDYTGRLAFREAQDDNLADLLEVITIPEAVEEPVDKKLALLHFTIAASLTQTLPPYNHVAYCDLRRADGSAIGRLYNAKVEVGD